MNVPTAVKGWLALSAVVAAGIASAVDTAGVKEALKPYVDRLEIPGYVSVLIDGDHEEWVADGWGDVDAKRPIGRDSLFRVCSQTKGIVGAAAAKLVAEGRLSLDEPVSKYLPEFAKLERAASETNGVKTLVPVKNVLTVRDCLSHTGGFPFETRVSQALGWTGAPLRVAAAATAATPLLFEPRTSWKYSNAGIDVAGAVIEVVTGEKIEDHLKRVFFDPLGMRDTTFRPTAEQLKRLVEIYAVETNKTCRPMPKYRPLPEPYDSPDRWPSCGAGLFSTPRDMVEFYRMLAFGGVARDGRRVMPEKAVTDVLAVKQTPSAVKTAYSLGMFVEGDWFGHDGALKTAALLNPKRRAVWLWMMQCEYPGRINRWHQYRVWRPVVNRFFERTRTQGERAVVAGENAAFSPDGTRLAFQRLDGDVFKIGVVGMCGGAVEWIEDGPGNAAYPAWTPSGGLVYMAGHDHETAYEAWRGNSSSGYNLRLFEKGKKRNLTTGRCRDYTPTVSPDGRKVYFVTTRGVTSESSAYSKAAASRIAELDLASGGEPRVLVDSPNGNNSGFVQPAVSPDGTLLVWGHLESFFGTWRIYGTRVGAFARRDLCPVSPSGLAALSPRWHPDGKIICFTGFRAGDPGWGVWVEEIATGKVKRLASGENPVFSPDGKSIAYDRGGTVYVRPFGAADVPDEIMPESREDAEPEKVLWSVENVTKETSFNMADAAARVPSADSKFAFGNDRTFFSRVRVRLNGSQDLRQLLIGDYKEHEYGFQTFARDYTVWFSTRDIGGRYLDVMNRCYKEAREYTFTAIRTPTRLMLSGDGAVPAVSVPRGKVISLENIRRFIVGRGLKPGDVIIKAEVGTGWPNDVPKFRKREDLFK